MKLKIQIAVESDDGKVRRQTVNELALTTSTPGLDPNSAKQDFLQQAEGLARTVMENQLPALYDVVDREAAAVRDDEEDASGGQTELQGKIAAMKKRRAEKAAAVVKCTECGVEVPSDAAHYVTSLSAGKYDGDAVLCDSCYRRLVIGGEETNAADGNGEGA